MPYLLQLKDTPPYNQDGYNRFLKKQCELLALPPISSHNLRHSVASLLLLESNDQIAIKERMGHSKIEITMNMYGHVLENGDAALANTIDGIIDKLK